MAVNSKAFCTVSDVVTFYSGAAEVNTVAVEELINSISGIMIRRLGRDVSYDAAWVENLKSRGEHLIRLSRPITTLTSIVRLNMDTTTAETISTSDVTIEDDGQNTGFAVLRHHTGWPNTGQQRMVGARFRAPTRYFKLLRITYAGGWVTAREDQEAGTSQSETIPDDIRVACAAAVVENLRNFNLGDRTRGDGNTMYGSAPRTFLPQRVEDTLKGYIIRKDLSR